MPSATPPVDASAPPPTFIGLVFAINGWTLIETVLLSRHAGLRAHVTAAVIALYLAATSVRRLKLPRQCLAGTAGSSAAQRSGSVAARLGSALLLLVAGALTGAMILAGSGLLLGLAAAALSGAPWSRIAFCRERVVVAGVVTCAGMGLPLLVVQRPVGPIFFLVSGWVFWLCAMVAVLGRIARLWRAERDIKAAARAASTGPA